MTIQEWIEIATAAFTIIGVIASLYMSVKALREVQIDRKLQKEPYLAFETGGQKFPIEIIRQDDRTENDEMSASMEIVRINLKTEDGRIKNMYGKLRNFGLGPAIETKIIWIPQEIWLGTEKFHINEEKLLEKKYSNQYNTIPASPGHILPGQEGKFFRIPAFIQRDTEMKITKVDGMIEIQCYDVFRNKHTVRQKYHLFTGYKEETPYIHFTFSDLID